jgi:Tfp pilus assembly protein PilV
MEVMVAILILGIGLVGLTQGITAALRSGKDSEEQAAATLLAAGQIELVRAEGALIDGFTEGDGGEGPNLYHWQQTISAAGIDGLHKVKVDIQNVHTGETVFELETLLFEAPAQSAVGAGANGPTAGRNSRHGRGL